MCSLVALFLFGIDLLRSLCVVDADQPELVVAECRPTGVGGENFAELIADVEQ